MKSNSLHRSVSPLAACVVGFALSALSANAAVTISSTAPTVDGADISQTLTQFSKSFNGAASLGQSITTGSNVGGYQLNSFTMLSNTAVTNVIGADFSVRIIELSAVATTGTVNYTLLTTQSTGFTFTGGVAIGDFMTFTLAPVSLDPSKIYGIEVDVTNTGTGTAFGVQMAARGSNPYANGNFYTPVNGVTASSGSVSVNTEDLTFYTDIAAVPEPSAALLGGLGMLALLRRRR